MTLDEIRTEFVAAQDIPKAALAAAIEQAEALLPEVTELIDLACERVVLTWPQEKLMFYGLFALAAARRTEIYAPLLALIEARSHDLDWLLSDAELCPLLVSTFDPEEDVPFDLLHNPDVDGDAKSSLFLFIARLVWEGRAAREALVAELHRFDREAAEDPDDIAWYGWQGAISLLGLAEFEERVRTSWEAGRMAMDGPAEQAAWIEELHEAARHPGDGQRFAAYDAEPIGDISAALRRFGFFGFGAMEEENATDDPARDIRLTGDERRWLSYFLSDPVIQDGIPDLECVDGFVTALGTGPTPVRREERWGFIWRKLGNGEPVFQTDAQERYLRELLDRHWETLERRLAVGYRHDPAIDENSPPEPVEEWAHGFSIGMDLQPGSWDRIAQHKQAGLAIASVILLLPAEALAEEGEELEPLDEAARINVVRNLPDIIRMIHAFWHDRPVPPLIEPRRVQKVGRNEPCPCGSGRKYKKCCGAT